MDTVTFWNSYHAAISSTDWYADAEVCWKALQSAFQLLQLSGAALQASGNVFHIGCGSSALGDILEDKHSDELHDCGGPASALSPVAAASHRCERRVVINVDFSEPVIAAQRMRRPSSVYEVCDVRDGAVCAAVITRALSSHSSGTGYRPSGIEVVVDKGTFDALLQKESCAESRADAARCLRNLVDCLALQAGASSSSSPSSSRRPRPCGTIAIMSIIEPQKRWPFLHWALEGMGARRKAPEPAMATASAALRPAFGACPLCAMADSAASSAGVPAPPTVDPAPTADCAHSSDAGAVASPGTEPSVAASAAASPLVTPLHACSFESEAFACRLTALEINCTPLEVPTQKAWFLYLLSFDAEV